jgi:hypothetical protein
MKQQKRHDTSLAIVRAVCAHVCNRRPFDILLSKKFNLVGLPYSRTRCRCTVEEIYDCLGARYFQRAYRMTYESFLFLHEKLSSGIAKAVDDGRHYKQMGGRGGNYKPPPVRNGPVSTCVRLACTLQYFAGGLPYDITAKYGIFHAAVLESIWVVVEAVNSYDEFIIEYPASEIAQSKIACEF